MLRQSLRPVWLKGSRAWLTPMPAARMGISRPYSENVMSNSLPKRSSDDPAQTLPPLDSISAVVTHDHRQIERYYQKIISSKEPAIQRQYQNAFVWELARHAVAEELVVYPSLETGVDDGKAMADKDRAEHQVTKEQLYKFQNLKPGDSDFIPTLEVLMKDLKMHIKNEEEHDLVKLEKALVPSRSRRLAEQFEMTKSFTPTRSHPSAPNKPPFETAVGLMTAPLDKLRDIFRSWPQEDTPKPAAGSPGR
ncbi:hypothetical protein AAE478_008648 [Parahypoxylon ruwenzoriense]